MARSHLFQPLTLRGVTFRNRIGVSPMCQYSCTDGFPNDWHFIHLGSRAIGGAGLVMVEATGVTADGRISPGDAGIWKDEQTDPWRRIASVIAQYGAVPAMQLAHAGWKASTAAPWLGGLAVQPDQGGWQPVGVGSTPFTDGYPTPRQLSEGDLDALCESWKVAALRAVAAGFKLIEMHAAHGYLAHSFLSPISNKRTDKYGGSFENRSRLALRIAETLRSAIPSDLPMSVRLSCTDWVEGGWTLHDSVKLAGLLRDRGVDFIDCSSGGISSTAKIPVGPGYQTEFAAAIRREALISTAAVGMITEPHQAETILRTGQADLVFLAREMLRDPYWPRTAAHALGEKELDFTPVQYGRGW